KMAWVNHNHAMEGIVHERDGQGHTDAWGVRWVREGGFNQIAHFPLEAATRDEVLSYEFPFAETEPLLANMVPLLDRPDEFFVGCDVSPCVFEMAWRLTGMERTLSAMAGDRELAESLFTRCADFAVALSEAACSRFALDWLWAGDDVAGQECLLMSPTTWRALIRPQLQRVFDVGRVHGLPVAYHCCGALRPIIGDLVEMGLNVLNPVQCNCPGMDPLALKREFGEHLTFMGGVDTQELLPRGSVDDVRRATRALLDGMTADGGGYILAASHTIPPETPVDNVFAMYAEAGLSREMILDRAAALRRARR
ncbi:MAG: hypothetical protein HZB16_22400, partial [Armatimonadetes bacterium]|nr:hypothetical protein [Armatimonadota bacterium]